LFSGRGGTLGNTWTTNAKRRSYKQTTKTGSYNTNSHIHTGNKRFNKRRDGNVDDNKLKDKICKKMIFKG
jgi:hypothetical protein